LYQRIKDIALCLSRVAYRKSFTSEKNNKKKERKKEVGIKEVTTPNQHLGETGIDNRQTQDMHWPAEHGETVCRSHRNVTSNA